jgi:hypothetical protein
MTRLDAILVAAVIALFLLARAADAQEPPDAPTPQPPPIHWYQRKCCATIPTSQVFRSKALYTYLFVGASAMAFDNIMTKNGIAHQDHRAGGRNCVEGNKAFSGPDPSGREMLRIDAPEFAAEAIFATVATKIRMPKWMMFLTLAYPVTVHLEGGFGWYDNCW